MEAVIGILDEQAEYAKRLARYINDSPELACLAVAFQSVQELEQYCEKKKLRCLLTSQRGEEELFWSFLQEEGKLCFISEEPVQEEHAEKTAAKPSQLVFRYQRAERIVAQLQGLSKEADAGTGEWYLVYSLTSAVAAERAAWELAKKLALQGRTLFLPWEPFGAWERETENTGRKTISDLLYALRKKDTKTKQLFSDLPRKEGVEYVCGADYYTDLWQYSCEEMQALLTCCKEYGEYQSIVFLAGFCSKSIERAMEECGHICLLYSSEAGGERRLSEFIRQMKYAGKQTLLSHCEQIREEEVEMAVARIADEKRNQAKGENACEDERK